MPIGQLEAETEAHAGKYACKPSNFKVFFFPFLKNGYLRIIGSIAAQNLDFKQGLNLCPL